MNKFTDIASLMLEFEKLTSERDALLQELHKANSIIIDLQRNPPKFTAEYLREIEAKAGRSGFVAGINARRSIEYDVHNGDWMAADKAADEYAAKVRQGSA